MFKKLFFSFMCLGYLSSCVLLHHHADSKKESVPVYTKQVMPSFHRVQITGLLNVNIRNDVSHAGIFLKGDPRDVAHVQWQVKSNTLYVDLGKGYPQYGQVTVDISSRYLTSFMYQGHGDITGQHLKTSALDLDINNTGTTILRGQIGLRDLKANGSGKIIMHGLQSRAIRIHLSSQAHLQMFGVADVAVCTMKDASWLSLYWLKSQRLKVRGTGSSFVQFAGVTDFMDVELWDQARFNGRYLRATRSFVKTHDHARADISVVHSDHTLANDASNIYYYNLPTMKADFMGCNGSVLDMREWSLPFIQEPTPYNL